MQPEQDLSQFANELTRIQSDEKKKERHRRGGRHQSNQPQQQRTDDHQRLWEEQQSDLSHKVNSFIVHSAQPPQNLSGANKGRESTNPFDPTSQENYSR